MCCPVTFKTKHFYATFATFTKRTTLNMTHYADVDNITTVFPFKFCIT